MPLKESEAIVLRTYPFRESDLLVTLFTRLEGKVRELARTRLDDGQFEECDLTLRDLRQIENAINKTLLGIYHGRVTYPSRDADEPPAVSAATA